MFVILKLFPNEHLNLGFSSTLPQLSFSYFTFRQQNVLFHSKNKYLFQTKYNFLVRTSNISRFEAK